MSVNEVASLHWFFADFSDIPLTLPNRLVVEDVNLAHHLGTVMRIRQGESLVLVNQSEKQPYRCRFESVQGKQITVTVLERLPVAQERQVQIIAAVSLIKGQRWDWMLQKLTELGVSQIVPLETERTVIDVKDPSKKLDRWFHILKSASEQSERLDIPVLTEPKRLASFIKEMDALSDPVLKLVATERAGMPLPQVFQGQKTSSPVVFAIGPEGGWTNSEIELLQAGGFQSVSLGDKILRSETAALYLATVLHYVTAQNPG